jgi:hypothetical protein
MCSGDSYIIDVRRINLSDTLPPDDIESLPQELASVDHSEGDFLIKALCEVFKYALKFSSLEPEDQIHAYKTLKGRQLLFSYGCMRGIKIDESLVDSARQELETGPYIVEMLTFVNRYCYELSKVLSGQDLEEFERSRQLDAALERRKRSLRKIDSMDSGFDIRLHNGRRLTSRDVESFLSERFGRLMQGKGVEL